MSLYLKRPKLDWIENKAMSYDGQYHSSLQYIPSNWKSIQFFFVLKLLNHEA